MEKLVAIVCFLFLSAVASVAQIEKPQIETDRPDQSTTPVLIPKGSLQLETGFVYEGDNSSSLKQTNLNYNTTLIKYGVNEFFEFQFSASYLGVKIQYNDKVMRGFSPMAIGFKIKVADEKGLWPQTAVTSHLNVKTESNTFAPAYTAADILIACTHTLSSNGYLTYNAGVKWDGVSPEAIYMYTVSVENAITK